MQYKMNYEELNSTLIHNNTSIARLKRIWNHLDYEDKVRAEKTIFNLLAQNEQIKSDLDAMSAVA